MGRVGSAIIDFTEAAYDLELSDEEWLPSMLNRGLPVLEQGLGVAGMVYGRPVDGGPVTLLDVYLASGREDFPEKHLAALQTTPPDILRNQVRSGGASTASTDSGGDTRQLEHYTSYVDYCKDLLYITAVDQKGSGVAVVAPLAEVTTLSQQDAQRWQMLAAHVEAGHRLRQGIAGANVDREDQSALQEDQSALQEDQSALPHEADAILDAKSFQITEAFGEAKVQSTAKKLREAAVTVDRARGKMRKTDPDNALEIWKALVRGRWSMVDWFDTDGRRFVLAIPNSPDVTDPRGLSERESQVVTYAVLGHSNKMIAYRLGLSTSRVSTVLRSVMRKLGFRTRAQLVKQMGDFQALE